MLKNHNSEEVYVKVPLNLYQLILKELKDTRLKLAEQQESSESSSKNKIVIGIDPATGRLEAWLNE